MTTVGTSLQKAAERRLGVMDGQGYLVRDVTPRKIGGYREIATKEVGQTSITRETLFPGLFEESALQERFLVFVGHEAYTDGCEERDTAPPSCVPAHHTWYDPDVCDYRTWYAVFTEHEPAEAYAMRVTLPTELLQR